MTVRAFLRNAVIAILLAIALGVGFVLVAFGLLFMFAKFYR